MNTAPTSGATAAKPSLKERYDAMSSGSKTALIGGAAVVAILTVGTLLGDDQPPGTPSKPATEKTSLTVYNPNSAMASTEALSAELQAARRTMTEQAQQMQVLQEQVKQGQGQGPDGRWSEIANLTAQMQSMQERINNMQSNGGGGGALPATAPTSKGILESSLPKLRDTLIEGMGGTVPNTAAGLQAVPPGAPPPPGFPASAMNASGTAAPAAGGAEGATAAPTSGGPFIQVVGNDKKSSSSSAAKKESAPAYIPSGSNFEAVLMTGMDASTSISANRNPTPALLRVKSDAILPNMFNFSVRECFVMVGGFGNMSSERVEMRTENMSCISEDGSVYEGKIEAYLVGEDGKAGARGRVVSKQGALLAKGFMAGFVGGIGQAFQPQPIQALNVNATGGSSPGYQFPNGDQVLGNAISSGLNRSGTALANFYIKLAEQMFPVVELDAGRKMTIVLLKGVELKMESKR